MKYASHINDSGFIHIMQEINRLRLAWNASAVCSDIEDSISFQELKPGVGDSMSYEISNKDVGINGYLLFWR